MKINTIALIILLSSSSINNSVQADHKSDHRIRKSVDRTIDQYPTLDDDLNFKVKDAYVTLTGELDNESEEKHALEVVSAIKGVKGINNKLNVETRSTCEE